jgi:hypothetical protein
MPQISIIGAAANRSSVCFCRPATIAALSGGRKRPDNRKTAKAAHAPKKRIASQATVLLWPADPTTAVNVPMATKIRLTARMSQYFHPERIVIEMKKPEQ